uniref:Uncharacterized protein n=1 Tax=Salix viminalis TaxID=40686 RepID=A0A6N2NCB5_SALVM
MPDPANIAALPRSEGDPENTCTAAGIATAGPTPITAGSTPTAAKLLQEKHKTLQLFYEIQPIQKDEVSRLSYKNMLALKNHKTSNDLWNSQQPDLGLVVSGHNAEQHFQKSDPWEEDNLGLVERSLPVNNITHVQRQLFKNL